MCIYFYTTVPAAGLGGAGCTLACNHCSKLPRQKMGPGKGGGHFWHPFPERNITQIPSLPLLLLNNFPPKNNYLYYIIIILHILIPPPHFLISSSSLAESALERQDHHQVGVLCLQRQVQRYTPYHGSIAFCTYTASPTVATSTTVVDMPRSPGGG